MAYVSVEIHPIDFNVSAYRQVEVHPIDYNVSAYRSVEVHPIDYNVSAYRQVEVHPIDYDIENYVLASFHGEYEVLPLNWLDNINTSGNGQPGVRVVINDLQAGTSITLTDYNMIRDISVNLVLDGISTCSITINNPKGIYSPARAGTWYDWLSENTYISSGKPNRIFRVILYQIDESIVMPDFILKSRSVSRGKDDTMTLNLEDLRSVLNQKNQSMDAFKNTDAVTTIKDIFGNFFIDDHDIQLINFDISNMPFVGRKPIDVIKNVLNVTGCRIYTEGQQVRVRPIIPNVIRDAGNKVDWTFYDGLHFQNFRYDVRVEDIFNTVQLRRRIEGAGNNVGDLVRSVQVKSEGYASARYRVVFSQAAKNVRAKIVQMVYGYAKNVDYYDNTGELVQHNDRNFGIAPGEAVKEVHYTYQTNSTVFSDGSGSVNDVNVSVYALWHEIIFEGDVENASVTSNPITISDNLDIRVSREIGLSGIRMAPWILSDPLVFSNAQAKLIANRILDENVDKTHEVSFDTAFNPLVKVGQIMRVVEDTELLDKYFTITNVVHRISSRNAGTSIQGTTDPYKKLGKEMAGVMNDNLEDFWRNNRQIYFARIIEANSDNTYDIRLYENMSMYENVRSQMGRYKANDSVIVVFPDGMNHNPVIIGEANLGVGGGGVDEEITINDWASIGFDQSFSYRNSNMTKSIALSAPVTYNPGVDVGVPGAETIGYYIAANNSMYFTFRKDDSGGLPNMIQWEIQRLYNFNAPIGEVITSIDPYAASHVAPKIESDGNFIYFLEETRPPLTVGLAGILREIPLTPGGINRSWQIQNYMLSVNESWLIDTKNNQVLLLEDSNTAVSSIFLERIGITGSLGLNWMVNIGTATSVFQYYIGVAGNVVFALVWSAGADSNQSLRYALVNRTTGLVIQSLAEMPRWDNWREPIPSDNYCLMSYNDRYIYIVEEKGNASTYYELWEYDTQKNQMNMIYTTSSYLYLLSVVGYRDFIVNEGNSLRRIRNGAVVWNNGNDFWPLTFSKNYGYYVSGSVLYKIDINSGGNAASLNIGTGYGFYALAGYGNGILLGERSVAGGEHAAFIRG